MSTLVEEYIGGIIMRVSEIQMSADMAFIVRTLSACT